MNETGESSQTCPKCSGLSVKSIESWNISKHREVTEPPNAHVSPVWNRPVCTDGRRNLQTNSLLAGGRNPLTRRCVRGRA